MTIRFPYNYEIMDLREDHYSLSTSLDGKATNRLSTTQTVTTFELFIQFRKPHFVSLYK